MEEGISLFSTLLNNKHFLIVFVHALEQQKDFAVRDRYELQQNEEPCWQSAHLRGVPCAPQETLWWDCCLTVSAVKGGSVAPARSHEAAEEAVECVSCPAWTFSIGLWFSRTDHLC